MKNRFLPVSKEDMKERKIEQLDFVYVTGDAYVDHPSFGHAIIGRLLESRGYTVGMIPQPDWKTKDGAWASETRVPCERRQYGFDGKSLFRIQKAPAERFLYAGRRDGTSSGLCGRRLLQSDPAGL